MIHGNPFQKGFYQEDLAFREALHAACRPGWNS
jgi:hypothetical protein